MLGRAVDLEVPRPGRPDEPHRSRRELEITEVGDDERGRYAVADAWLWVDGKRIYAVREPRHADRRRRRARRARRRTPTTRCSILQWTRGSAITARPGRCRPCR